MKKAILFLTFMIGMIAAQADNYKYPYLVFVTNDGNVHSMSVTSLRATIADGCLVVANDKGSLTIALSKLNKMYFSNKNTSAIKGIDNGLSLNDVEIYNLQGRKVMHKQMRRGIYVVKNKNRRSKMVVK